MQSLNKAHLSIALKHLADKQLGLLQKGRVDKATATYVSALGPSLRSTGLLATLAIYASDTAGQGAAAKGPVLRLIAKVLADDDIALLPKETDRKSVRAAQTLFHWAKKQPVKEHARIQRQLEAATAAVKVAIRTYEIPKS